MKNLLLLVLSIVLFTSCEKPGLEICGTVENGRIDGYSGMTYLTVNGKEYWVSSKVYESYFVNDYICLSDY